MNVNLRRLDNGNILVRILGSGMGKIIKPDEAFHGVPYRRLKKMGDGDHWLKERLVARRAGTS